MNPEGGYTRSYRRLWSNPVFRSKAEAAVFAWMKDTAQWRDTRISTTYGPIGLRVGEVLIAERELAADFNLHRNTLRSLLHRMVAEGMITLIRDRCPHRAGTIAYIENYKVYQGLADTSGDAQDRNDILDRTEEGPKEDRSGTKNKEFNSVNQLKKESGDGARARVRPDHEAGDLPLGPALVAAEAVQIIAAFDTARLDAFGSAAEPRFPAQTDRIDAARWLAAGAEAGMAPGQVVELCADVFAAVHGKLAKRRGRAPRTLAFHNQDMADAFARMREPLPAGQVSTGAAGRSRGLTGIEMLEQIQRAEGGMG